MRLLVIVLSLGTGVALLSGPARADIPPDPSSPDAHCTEEEQCKGGTFCDYAFRPGEPGGESASVGEDCRKEAVKKGLQRRCRSGGNYSGAELFCPPGATGTWSAGTGAAPEPPAPTDPAPVTTQYAPPPPPASPATPAPAAKSGCSVHGGAPGGALLIALFGLSRRRRR